MSYILEALRKADAERERGQVPGIHAQQLALASADMEGGSQSRTWLWASLGLSAALLVLVALLAWHSFGREPVMAAAPNPMTPAPAAAPEANAAPAAPATATVPIQTAETLAPATQPAAAQPEAGHAATRHAPKPEAVKRAVTPETQMAKAVADTPTAAPSSKRRHGTHAKTENIQKGETPAHAQPSSSPRTYALNELPPEIRQQLPALTVGGASYSSNPSSRMLIVNGQVFHEHDRLTPDLQLQQIRLKSAVLDFKGYRYEIKY